MSLSHEHERSRSDRWDARMRVLARTLGIATEGRTTSEVGAALIAVSEQLKADPAYRDTLLSQYLRSDTRPPSPREGHQPPAPAG